MCSTLLEIHRLLYHAKSFLAITDKMLPELGMNTNDFNYGQTIFLVSFLSAEFLAIYEELWKTKIKCSLG